MDEQSVLYALGNYVISPLPDVKEDNSPYFTTYEEIDAVIPYKIMTINEARQQAKLNALRIFKSIYDNDLFLITSDDAGTAEGGYSDYTSAIDQSLLDLEEMESQLNAIIQGNAPEESMIDYLYTEFENKFKE